VLAFDQAYADEYFDAEDRILDRVDGTPHSAVWLAGVTAAERPGMSDRPAPPFVRCRACGALNVDRRHGCAACGRTLRQVPLDEAAASAALYPRRPDSQVSVVVPHSLFTHKNAPAAAGTVPGA
jgi:hypothetical protein